MAEQAEPDLIILSDLHLSAGYNRRTGTYDRNEDFFYDAAFSRFIDVLLHRASAERRAWRLVILGDLADFLQVELPERRHGLTSAATSVAKLEVIARGHPEFFRALARFVAAGHPLDIVIGNHDIELIWPEVQARFRALLAEHGAAQVEERVTFHPWIFYRPGLVYAEHGQQYDSVNSFATLLRPQLPHRPEVIELPFGSFFVLYLFNQIERIDPFADNVKPVTRYLIWALRTRPIKVLATLGYHLRFFSQVLRKTSPLTREEQQARRERYRREVVRPAAALIGLPPEVLEAIDRLAAVPALASRWRQIVALLFDPLLAGGPLALALISLYQALSRLRAPRRAVVALAGALAGLLWRERRLMRPATDPGSYLHRAARAIDELLAARGLAVPAYVFGHTHTAERAPLSPMRCRAISTPAPGRRSCPRPSICWARASALPLSRSRAIRSAGRCCPSCWSGTTPRDASSRCRCSSASPPHGSSPSSPMPIRIVLARSASAAGTQISAAASAPTVRP